MNNSKFVILFKINLEYNRYDRFTFKIFVDKSRKIEDLLQKVNVCETLSDAS